MTCRIASRIVSGVIIVDVSGRLSVLEVALRDYLQKFLEEGHRDFVLNLSNVSFVDSFGLGQLISVWTSIQRSGGKMTLLRPPAQVQKLLQSTKLDTVFMIWADEQHAIAGARRGNPVA